MLWKERKRLRLEARMADALRALAAGDLEEARQLGRQLCESGYSGGYEILAAADQAEGRPDSAIAVLEDGVGRAPGVWALWEQLGNLYSDTGRMSEALEAYERALGCHGVDEDSIRFNRAIVFERMREPKRALEELDAIRQPYAIAGATALRVALLRALGRNREAIALATEALASCPVRSGPEADRAYREHVGLHALLAAALLDEEQEPGEALRHARACVEHGGAHREALWVLRQLTGTRAPSATRYTLTVRGRWPRALGTRAPAREFLRGVRVLAYSESDALELARTLEPPQVRPTLRIETVESIKPNRDPDALRGVYHASPHVFTG